MSSYQLDDALVPLVQEEYPGSRDRTVKAFKDLKKL
jgi:hypothetical protein